MAVVPSGGAAEGRRRRGSIGQGMLLGQSGLALLPLFAVCSRVCPFQCQARPARRRAEVAPVLASTAKTGTGGGDGAKASFVRGRTFTAECEAAINEQINIE